MPDVFDLKLAAEHAEKAGKWADASHYWSRVGEMDGMQWREMASSARLRATKCLERAQIEAMRAK